MRADRVRAAWTTNFDAMIEDGVAQIFGTRRFGLAVVGYSGRDRSVIGFGHLAGAVLFPLGEVLADDLERAARCLA
jgi:hypothetical protein